MTEEQRRKREFRPVGKAIRAKRAGIQAQKRIRFANGLLADSLNNGSLFTLLPLPQLIRPRRIVIGIR